MSSLHPSNVRLLRCHRREARMVPVQVEQLRVAVARTRRTSEVVRVRPAGLATAFLIVGLVGYLLIAAML